MLGGLFLLGKVISVLLAVTQLQTTPPVRQDHNYDDDRVPNTILCTNVTSTLQFSLVRPPLEHLDDEFNDKQANKPIAIYIPGIDGYGRFAEKYQFNDLASTFHLYRLTISQDDRSSFAFIVKAITDFLKEIQKVHNVDDDDDDAHVTLIGESCGGVFAAAVAIKTQKTASLSSLLQGLVLVNPATSFDYTSWAMVNGSLRSRGESERLLSPVLLEHRLTRWLAVGSEVVSSQLSEIKTPTLVIAAKDDRILPSKREAERLSETIEGCETLLVKDHGHFLWLDENVNLTEAILYSKIDPLNLAETQNPYDPITDWKLPSDIDQYVKNEVKPYQDAFSPVFFSTDSNGKRWVGMGKIPKSSNGTRPLLFVGNHQFAALDVRMLVSEMREQRGLFPRGLAHPVSFVGGENLRPELDWRTPGVNRESGSSKGAPTNPMTGGYESLGAISPQDFYRFGAVKVSPRSFYRLLQTGQNVMLFPGGGKEALSGKKSYPLFWPEKTDFVRIAAKFNATIVPLSAVGMVDSVTVLAEPRAAMKLPFIGDRMRKLFANITAARYDESPEDEALGLPIAIPALPARNYFIFGKPIETADIDSRDQKACEMIYREARQEVRRGIDDIIRAREHDPFRSFAARMAYEKVSGKKAPTFSVSELNNHRDT